MAANMLRFLLGITLVLVLACGSAADPTAAPRRGATPASAPTDAVRATVGPSVGATGTSAEVEPISARDNITMVINLEPTLVNLFFTGSGQISNSVHKDNLADPLTWQSGDDQLIVPTSASSRKCDLLFPLQMKDLTSFPDPYTPAHGQT